MGRTVPFAERHQSSSAAAPEPSRRRRGGASELSEPGPLLGADGKPARASKLAACPHCGAGPDRRVKSGFGPARQVTCEACAHEWEE